METVLEVIGKLVVLVTLGNTVVGTYVLRVHSAKDHHFVLADREDGLGLLQFGTGNDKQGKADKYHYLGHISLHV